MVKRKVNAVKGKQGFQRGTLGKSAPTISQRLFPWARSARDSREAEIRQRIDALQEITLMQMAASRDVGARIMAAKDPHATAAVIDMLARDRDPSIREMAAQHPNISPTAWHTLHNDKSERVRIAAGSNENARSYSSE